MVSLTRNHSAKLMNISKNDKVSPSTKILFKKLNRGREPNNSFYQSEFEKESKPKRLPKKSGPSLAKQALALLAGAVVGLLIVLSFKRPDIIKDSYTSVISLFTKPQVSIEALPRMPPKVSTTVTAKESESHLSFSDSQIKQAMRNVTHERQIREYKNTSSQKSYSRQGYQLEIELFSGGRIYTDNADIKKDAISYTNKKGLIVSINRDQVKTMKWVNVH